MLTLDLIKQTKENLNFPSKLFIGGNYKTSVTGKTFNNISPIDGKIINDVTFSQKEDVDIAVNTARKTFESGTWSRADPSFRKKILSNIKSRYTVQNENANFMSIYYFFRKILCF